MSALIIFNNPSYNAARWHMALYMMAFTLIPLVFNLYFRHILNTLETIGGVLHVVFFIVTIVTLGTMAQRSTTDYVFKTITTGISGWTNPGISFGIGLLTVIFPLAGEFTSTRILSFHANR